MTEINRGLVALEQVVHNNASGATELAEVIKANSGAVRQLRGQVSSFKVDAAIRQDGV